MKYKILKIQSASGGQRCRNKPWTVTVNRERTTENGQRNCVFYILFLIFGFIGGSASAKPKKSALGGLKPRE